LAICPNFSFVPSGVSPAETVDAEADPGEATAGALDPVLVAAGAAGGELLLETALQAASPVARTDTTTTANPERRAPRIPGLSLRIFSPNDIAAP
jgi:hypothetical protein